MKQILFLFLIGLTILSCSKMNNLRDKTSGIQIIPEPESIVLEEGTFTLKNKKLCLKISSNESITEIEEQFKQYISEQSGVKFIEDDSANKIGFKLNKTADKALGKEGYSINITKNAISVVANESAGLFYAVQSLRQLFPVNKDAEVAIACAVIKDKPKFGWRGTMLDVSRHFFSKQDIFKFIDNLALHKINTFHWHLVDDVGWRIEIKKYPKLTEIGAWRVDRGDVHWDLRKPQKPGEKASYGGFYSQEDVKEIVKYAEKRFITIVPEIELPAHTTSSLAAYPEYSCAGGPYTVLPGGSNPYNVIYCAGNDKTFEFLENIFDEVIELFSSKYIHIGGDEANKTEWKKCPKCQTRIKTEKLKDEHELQSYFIKRIEKIINSKGRRMIGWDEILEGGLAPEATVMSWRGFNGGIEAAKSGHDVIMTPTSHCYFDYYQGNPDNEPPAIGGFLPLKKVYEFNPIPKELTNEEAKYVLGGQCNLWTEFMPDLNQVEYMLNPRLAALSESVWSSAKKKDYSNFSKKLKTLLKLYETLNINYAKSIYQLTPVVQFDMEAKKFHVELQTEIEVPEIRYTFDGTVPTANSELYHSPLTFEKSTEIKAVAFVNGEAISNVISKKCLVHKATGAKYKLGKPVSPKYPAKNNFDLTNTLFGSSNYGDGNWCGFEGDDLDMFIEFDTAKEISSVTVGTLHSVSSWIFSSEYISIEVSDDGKKYREISRKLNSHDLQSGDKQIIRLKAKFHKLTTKYLRVRVKNVGKCPEWHGGAGGTAWLFVDEVVVE